MSLLRLRPSAPLSNMSRKSVLITGCSPGGMGFALAEEFQKRGLTIFATARDISKISELGSLPNVHLLPLDVTSSSDIEAAVCEVSRHTAGRLDILVNNSGQQYFMPALDIDIEAAMRMFDVNFWGVLRMTQAFSALMQEAKGWSSILDQLPVSSMSHS